MVAPRETPKTKNVDLEQNLVAIHLKLTQQNK